MQFRDFLPVSTNTSVKESCYGALGALIGLLGTALLCRWGLGLEVHWLIAPMGASAVLLFAAPASPLAQPWSILVGNGVSALMGVLSASLVPDMAIASALAVMLAIAAMFLTRSLHPPGGAVALTAVIGGEGIRALGVGYVLLPVLLNSLLLLSLGLLYNRALGRRYPHGGKAAPNRHQTADPQPSARLATQDIDFALQKHGGTAGHQPPGSAGAAAGGPASRPAGASGDGALPGCDVAGSRRDDATGARHGSVASALPPPDQGAAGGG